jgi:DNA-binding winged helix-turn-helix (wHTH) protein
MDAKTRSIKVMPLVVVLAGLLALQLVWLPKKSDVERRQYEDKINLALRQTGHRLLQHAGDSTGAIEPIAQYAENQFVLKLESPFNYDSLPVFLKTALNQYGIADDYLVTVNDCLDNKLLLGYARLDVEQQKAPPCGGREQHIACSNIHLAFTGSSLLGKNSAWYEKWTLALSLLLLGYFAFSFFKQKKQAGPAAPPPLPVAENAYAPALGSHLIRFGHSTFDFANQVVQQGSDRQELTFREAKLLHLFCKNTNQLLDRNFILQEVWEDEGVIVGRSLDVFVSRLRKILKNDDLVKITNVHGVGYRFEVADQQL